MFISYALFWYITGGLFLMLEMFGISGIGLFFAGLGAVGTGMLFSFGLLDSTSLFMTQFGVFSALSFGFGVLLWKPFKNFMNHNAGSYHHITGNHVDIIEDLQPGKMGSVKWGGTIMRAKLAKDQTAIDYKSANQAVVDSVQDGVLMIKKKAKAPQKDIDKNGKNL
jgi:membrane protein implicated in regulation of membrane protease activity